MSELIEIPASALRPGDVIGEGEQVAWCLVGANVGIMVCSDKGADIFNHCRYFELDELVKVLRS